MPRRQLIQALYPDDGACDVADRYLASHVDGEEIPRSRPEVVVEGGRINKPHPWAMRERVPPCFTEVQEHVAHEFLLRNLRHVIRIVIVAREEDLLLFLGREEMRGVSRNSSRLFRVAWILAPQCACISGCSASPEAVWMLV